jgi:hypothetical protein
LVDDTFTSELKDKVIKNKNGQTIGKVITNRYNIGIAITSALKIGTLNISNLNLI